ncbi:histone-like nucleoid-structuring protein, MvaT/MvaU family [Billgrantia endophytica]|uniref:histone-like nucleoid-structuring protein, MvaT/MvaU family n=1 Tax=Billgrantia endophytica TaxID=2033802 RepID=UPI0026B63ACC
MSSLINTYAQKEQMLKQLQQELLELENNDNLKKELEFKEQLEMLMKEYGKSASEVKELLFPNAEPESKKKSTRKPRKLKIYKNPITGEVVETRGGNQKQLKIWKDEHGDEVVEGWLINDDADNQETPDVTPPIDGKEENKSEEKSEPKSKGQKKEEKTEGKGKDKAEA